MTGNPPFAVCPADDLASAVAGRVEKGARFCGLFARPDGSGLRLMAVVSCHGTLAAEEAILPPGQRRYRSLTPEIPAAGWYERELHDLFGIEPEGHPRLDPLVLPRGPGTEAPCPGSGRTVAPIEPDLRPLPAHVRGEGVFTIPYGPVRSGVFESVEYLVETTGEDIPHLRTRVFYKHRGLQARAVGLDTGDGALLAERMEGVASVAHAIAYATAVERVAGVAVPEAAQLVRVVHAELERIANHLDTMVRHTEGAGQAVAYACLSHHKERVQRLRAQLCGSRFGRGVVVPGGVAGPLRLDADRFRESLRTLAQAIDKDTRRLMGTPSFVDRLRGTGVLSHDDARRFAVVGPVGRASGLDEDVRLSRPYSAYGHLGHRPTAPVEGGDALARQTVRLAEIGGSFHLVRQAVDLLDGRSGPEVWRAPVEGASGAGLGWAETPQGETLVLVELVEGRLVRWHDRSAGFQNLAAFAAAFPKDILTDFAFIEASFGISVAGVAS